MFSNLLGLISGKIFWRSGQIQLISNEKLGEFGTVLISTRSFKVKSGLKFYGRRRK